MRRLLCALVLALVPLAAGAQDLKTDKGLVYRQWLPKDFAAHRHDLPLILFSHGIGGCAQQSSTLTQALADHGYVVLAPNHDDAACGDGKGNWLARLLTFGDSPDAPFSRPAAWSDKTEADRRDDMEALLNYALSHDPIKSAVDPNHIAVMGHSLGGYVALGMAGAWPSWRDKRIKAVLALSPYAAPFVLRKRLKELAVPVMYQTGTQDWAMAPPLLKGGGYAQTPSPKYLLVLRGAAHMAWTQLNPAYQSTIAAYAIAFFDRNLMHRAAPLLTQPPGRQVARYRHAS